MEVRLFQPSAALAPFIECIYSLRRDVSDPPVEYLTFPSNVSMVSLLADATVEVDGDRVTVTPTETGHLDTYLARPSPRPAWVRYEGAVREITVYFRPLGLNAFLTSDLEWYYEYQYPRFDPYPDYVPAMRTALSMADDAAAIGTIEAYWLGKLRGFEHMLLRAVVADLEHGDGSVNISTIATSHETTRPTLNRHFAMHLCRTPSDFRRIVRFRRALARYRERNHGAQLSTITYQAAYFDQSHMTKEFRALTGLAPGRFFSRLSSLDGGRVNWLFLSPRLYGFTIDPLGR